MYYDSHSLVFSPSDLCRFVASRFASWLDRYALERPGEVVADPAGDDVELVRRKGRDHERAYVQSLIDEGARPFDPRQTDDPYRATLAAMRRGEPLIQQAALTSNPFRGYADLLVRVDRPSDFGGHSYVPREIKLGLSAKPKYTLQLCAYAEMLEALQGRRPATLELVLGDGTLSTLPTHEFVHYYREQRAAFLDFQRTFDPATRPTPELGDDHGAWATAAARQLEATDHLSRVAHIRKTQIRRLEAAGIATMTDLADSDIERVPKLDAAVFDRLRRQARLQRESAGLERPQFEVLVCDPEGPPRGLALLPPPSRNDVYFDMEGYPLVAGGLEYLFGASCYDSAELVFHDWWAHSRDEEKLAFEKFVDWVHERFRSDPSMHVYHYAAYEVTALKRLMNVHGTREAQVDQLLRNQVFVDLYNVVRGGFVIGEPQYSIKNVERLYRRRRAGDVTSAVGSIVQYQRFLDDGAPCDWRRSPILAGIRDYNRDDCESTAQLARWLLSQQREHGIVYRGKAVDEDPGDADDDVGEAHRRRRDLAKRLLSDGADDPLGRLLGHLVEFHRREDKPKWWDVYRRRDMTDEELFDDLASLGRLERIEGSEHAIRRSRAVRYRFDPDQDTKFDQGDTFFVSHDLELKGKIETFDREAGEVVLLFGPQVVESDSWPPPARLSLIKHEFIPTDSLAGAVERTVRDWLGGRPLPPALAAFLGRERPRLRGHVGGRIVKPGESPGDGSVRVVSTMDGTTLSIQGPPGTGKTYTAARMALDLLSRGKRVGVMSNSHKAILNLLAKCAELHGTELKCLKVGGAADDSLLEQIAGVRHVGGGRQAAQLSRDFNLVGGTAWLFCRRDMDRSFDYLFVDEAGQVAVANLVAVAGAAANLVLVGDQMQLAQPTQAQHPEHSGTSTLEYLLEGERTIPPDTGVLLDVTYRLHPDICRLNSEAFYEGKLRSAPGCEKRQIRVPADGTPHLTRGAGVVFVPVEHYGNTQGSDEEAEVVRQLFAALSGLEYTDTHGRVAGRLGTEQILVVAPYNMQVRTLRHVLPHGARIGTVDKFQGQEAPVVIVSMCASEGHDSPRGIEFLLNPNRLNVALSRAQSLAIVVGQPQIAKTRCRTLDQMRLVNLYCRIVGVPATGAAVERVNRS